MSSSRSSSSSVPIPECMFRSPSKLQLTMDEQVADQRDFAFFTRLVSGISERRASSSTSTTNNATIETDRCLTHIIQTRHHQQSQSHDDQEQDPEEKGHYYDRILIEDNCYYTSNQVGGGEAYYVGEGIDCFASSSSTSSSSSNSSSSFLHQHELCGDYDDEEQKKATHCGNNGNDNLEGGDYECMFDLEL